MSLLTARPLSRTLKLSVKKRSFLNILGIDLGGGKAKTTAIATLHVDAKDGATVGVGAGQMNRRDSARIAAIKAREAAETYGWPQPRTVGSAVASDAFFPFADGLLAAVEAGATAVIQPGGSIRDDEVIAAADEAGLAMVFTGMRHFRH